MREASEAPADEPDAKRVRKEGPSEDSSSRKRELEEYEPFSILSGQAWTDVLQRLQTFLPKSGAQSIDLETWPGSFIKDHCQLEQVKEIKAIKGVERYMIGNPECSRRQTISLCRKTQRIMDLGVEEWNKLPQTRQRRKAIPSHIMISIFGSNTPDLEENQPKSESVMPRYKPEPSVSQQAEEDKIPSTIREAVNPLSEGKSEENGQPLAAVPAWSPSTTINSGPKFLELNSRQQTMIRKMHNNLGHPVAEKLGDHMQRLGFTKEMVEGAKDFQCQSCAERVPPKLTTPGKLKEPKEFNERVSLDGFEWKNQKGNKFYVLISLTKPPTFT